MNRAAAADRLVWAFWVAAGIALVGGFLPLLFGGTSSRMASAAIPFTVAAAAMAACGFVHGQGRAVTSVLYFVAGLALVYGTLSMFAVPLELAVLGSCPPAPQPCVGGVGRPLTVGENTGMGFAAGFALVSLFVGFFGLVVVFRKPLLPAAAPPPDRKIPPLRTDAAAPVAAKAADGSAAASGEAEPETEAEAGPELPAHVEEELPELPPPDRDPPTT